MIDTKYHIILISRISIMIDTFEYEGDRRNVTKNGDIHTIFRLRYVYYDTRISV